MRCLRDGAWGYPSKRRDPDPGVPVIEPVLPVAQRLAILHVWSYGESAGDLPNLVQKLLSLKDIASRLG